MTLDAYCALNVKRNSESLAAEVFGKAVGQIVNGVGHELRRSVGYFGIYEGTVILNVGDFRFLA